MHATTNNDGQVRLCRIAALLMFSLVSGRAKGDETTALIQYYCVDCHGAVDESPEGGFSLAAPLGSSPGTETGPAWKRALDAIEGFDMPPADGDQPSADERMQLANGIRQWLTRPTLGGLHDPGRPVLRRLTRLEYNNTVRDLLGLETDVFMFSERLPFERGHYQPPSRQMPDRITMAAREYGAKYPVLLRDASLPGDSRAEHGFANRGDAQNLSAVRLQQYVNVAGEIAFHPELLSRAQRMEELFPGARFRESLAAASPKSKPLTTSQVQLAGNGNVLRTADGSAFDLETFRQRLDVAYAQDRGGVLGGEELRKFAYLIQRLSEIREADGSLLDCCLLAYGSGMGNGTVHDYNDLPILTAGGLGGAITTGMHFQFQGKIPLANLWLTVAQAAGVEIDAFADSTGPVDLSTDFVPSES